MYSRGVATLLKVRLTRAHACQSFRSVSWWSMSGRMSAGRSLGSNGSEDGIFRHTQSVEALQVLIESPEGKSSQV